MLVLYLLLPLILLAPLAELWLIIEFGTEFGVFPTLFAIVATAVIGLVLIQKQGVDVLFRARSKMQADEVPIQEVMEGVLIAIAGFFLLIPGFITDTLGFLLLITPLRRVFVGRMSGRMQMVRFGRQTGTKVPDGEIFEGEFSRKEESQIPLDKK